MGLADFEGIFSGKKDPFPAILGQERTKAQLKAGLLMDRHVLIMGPPGVGKTTLAKSVARLLPDVLANDCPYHCDPKAPLCPACRTAKAKPKARKVAGEERFVRVQGSPDLMVEDLLGDIDPVKALQYGPSSLEAFTPGKLFRANRGVLFFDELNRCPEKLQNALLQVLEEGKATIGAYTVELPADFIFIGTMNPEETAATEKLSDVLLDRFDIIHMTYPETNDIERTIVTAKGKKLEPMLFPEGLLMLAVDFVRTLREHKDVQRKPSVRATLGLYERAQAHAWLAGRKQVTAEDIAAAVISVLSHRLELKPSVKYLQTAEQFIHEQFRQYTHQHAELEHGGGSL